MAELDSAIEFARVANSAMALTRCLELRARLHGLLVDKVQVEHSTVDLRAAMARGLERTRKPLDVSDPQVIERTPHAALGVTELSLGDYCRK